MTNWSQLNDAIAVEPIHYFEKWETKNQAFIFFLPL